MPVRSLDSRGQPTVEVEVELASRLRWAGQRFYPVRTQRCLKRSRLRDGDKRVYEVTARSVLKAVANIEHTRSPACSSGRDATDQSTIDRLMIESWTGRRPSPASVLNAMLRLFAGRRGRQRPTTPNLPLYRYIGGARAHRLPVPCMNVSTAAHARTTTSTCGSS